jgi:hypothetical protein
MPTQGKGLYPKFRVKRVDGKDQPGGPKEGARYFVLDVTHDKFAIPAIAAYAAACEDEYVELADDLCDMIPQGQLAHEMIALAGLRHAMLLAFSTASDAGWYKDPETGEDIDRNFGEVVALMHSELSEALEADRKKLMDDKLPHRDGREVEFADCIIRIFDTAMSLGLDVAGAFIEKNRFNRERADHKLENRGKPGGKAY